MNQKTIGDQELALLREVDAVGSMSVAEAVELRRPAGLARSTVLTMFERLRAKGHLKRASVGGSYKYSAAIEPDSLVERAVESFVAKTLGGSVTPLVAFLAERGEVSAKERAELERLLDRLKTKEEEP